ncbi:hypothetical protein ACOMHN_047569 [Nucella lapillus]
MEGPGQGKTDIVEWKVLDREKQTLWNGRPETCLNTWCLIFRLLLESRGSATCPVPSGGDTLAIDVRERTLQSLELRGATVLGAVWISSGSINIPVPFRLHVVALVKERTLQSLELGGHSSGDSLGLQWISINIPVPFRLHVVAL